MAFVENVKLVAGDAIEAVGFTGAGVMSDTFGVAGFVPSNALTMLGDSAASETFSGTSFAAGGVAAAPKIGIVLAAIPKTVNGFGCTEFVELVDFGGSCPKLKLGFGFSDCKFSLFPTTNAFGFSASTFSFAAFAALLNENTGLSNLGGSFLATGGVFSTMGFVAGLNVNDVCD